MMAGKTDVRSSAEEDDCPLQPKFEGRTSSGAQQVKLTREKYVQLLVEARETDPGCWPPGFEGAAKLLERAREIEDACIAKHGDFVPEKLTKRAQDEYFKIHLALDDFQDDAAQDIEISLQSKPLSHDEEAALPLTAWPEFAPQERPDNFA